MPFDFNYPTMTDRPATPLGFATLSEPLRARIEAELAPGERLLWASQPDPNRPRGPRRARNSAWIWLAGWVVFGLAALMGMFVLPAQFKAGFGALVAALIASGGGVSLLVTYLLSAATFEGSWRCRAKFELYALTDRRALLWSPAVDANAIAVRQIDPGAIRAATVERVEYPDGLGNLIFQCGSDDSDRDGFFGVADVRRVDELIRRVLVPAISSPRLTSPFDPDDFEEPF